MKERPILFSGPMVRALLEGRKTQTRRMVKVQAPLASYVGLDLTTKKGEGIPTWCMHDGKSPDHKMIHCPYGQVGDRLWVREGYAEWLENPLRKRGNYEVTHPETGAKGIGFDLNICVAYKADDAKKSPTAKWRPSIHMPRNCSRILLEIVNVRVERLLDITEADAQAEGAPVELLDVTEMQDEQPKYLESYVNAFLRLWDSINGKDSAKANPWVWVVEFKTVEQKA